MQAGRRWPRLGVTWADGGHAGQLIEWAGRVFGWLVQTILRPVGAEGFVVLPRRRVVEWTFGWWHQYRRLAGDYEELAQTSEAMV